jgi:hypothetical protein
MFDIRHTFQKSNVYDIVAVIECDIAIQNADDDTSAPF